MWGSLFIELKDLQRNFSNLVCWFFHFKLYIFKYLVFGWVQNSEILSKSNFEVWSYFSQMLILILESYVWSEIWRHKFEINRSEYIRLLNDTSKKETSSSFLHWKWPSNPQKLDEMGQNSLKKISKKVWKLDPRPPSPP